MTLTAVLNAILSIGVAAMIVTPLIWTILTQPRGPHLIDEGGGATHSH